jgi:hypothetical protein
MTEEAMEATPIKGERLTAWTVLPSGTDIALDLVTTDGGKQRVVLPVDNLSGLMMTLPRMLQSALDARFPDGSFRVVQWLGNWQLEQQSSGDGLILRPGTQDGFESAFTLDGKHAGSLGAALLRTPCDSTLVRRLN